MRQRSTKHRLLSVILALTLLIGYMPIMNTVIPEVKAAEGDTISLDISNGSITITNTGYTYNGTTLPFMGSYTIIGSSTDTNKIIIDGYTGTVTLSDIMISHYREAPILVQNGSNVTLNIVGACVLKNGGTSSTNPYNWPGLSIGEGSNTVTISGSGSLSATGGKYCPAIGGIPSDEGAFVGARTSNFNSTVIIDGPTINATAGSGAPAIGTGRACNVTAGEFIFRSGKVNASGTSMNGCGIGLCESESLSGATFHPIGSFETKLTLRFEGAAVTALGGSYGAGIGAGRGQNAYQIYISGGAITATGGSYSPAIGGGGKTATINSIDISGGVLNLTPGSSAVAMGDGIDAPTTAVINISGGTVTATNGVTNKSPMLGSVSFSGYTDMSLEMNYDDSATAEETACKIPYSEYTAADYITTGFSSVSGTYYKTMAPTAALASKGKTVKWLKIKKCTAHTDDYTINPSDENTHNRTCHFCNHESSPVAHVWEYTASGKVITETCNSCGLKHTLTIEDSTQPFDNAEHEIPKTLDGFKGAFTEEYSSDGGLTYVSTKPTLDGVYTARISIGGVAITATLKVSSIAMSITASNVEKEYDGGEYSIAVTVSNPSTYTLEFSTNGVNYSAELPKFREVGKHLCYYRVKADGYTDVVGTRYVIITPKDITGIAVTGLDKPTGGVELDKNVLCESVGVASRNPSVYWNNIDGVEVSGVADYNTYYRGYFTVFPDMTGYAFPQSITRSDVTVNGSACEELTYNPDGSITVYVSETTAKAKITAITQPSDIRGLPNGSPKTVTGLNLPATVGVTCEDANVVSLPVTWTLTVTIGTNYDPAVETEQNFTVSGTVQVPDSLDAEALKSGGYVKTQVGVQVLCATVETITVDPEPGVYNEDTTVHLATARAGATIYYTLDGSDPSDSSNVYSNETGILLSGTQGERKNYTVRAIAMKPGLYSSVTSTFEYMINMADSTPPTAEINISDNRWSSFWSNVTFGLFSTNKQTVTIAYDDVGSGLKDGYYLLSSEELTVSDLKNSIEWVKYEQPFDIEDAGKYIIYAKAVDNENNITYVNSNGIVIYQNSTANTVSINAIPNVDQYVDFYVNLNGNTVKGISIGDLSVDSEDYEVNEVNGMITLKHTAFDNLSYGQYTITVNYNPQGVTYAAGTNNVEPSSTTLLLNVVKPKLLSITAPLPVDSVPNGTPMENLGSYLPGLAYVTTEDPTILTMPIEWDLTRVYSGSYDSNSLEGANFTLQGIVQLDSNVQRNNVSLNVTIGVEVLAAGTLAKPRTTIAPGRYANSVTVGLVSPDGAEIYYTLDGSIPTVDSGTRYTQPITLTTSAAIKAICHQDGLHDSSMLSASYVVTEMDTTAPTGTIAIGKESFWTRLWSGVLFNFFTKATQVATITGDDPESGIKAIFYYLSPVELSSEDLAKVTGWELYVEPLHMTPNTGGILYAKIVNNDDLFSYVNSNGVVVFTDAERVTDSATYVKGTKNDLAFTVKLNGNTIKAVRNGSTALAPNYYSQSTDGTVVISAAYLETLSTGNYVFNVDYYPLGINNANANGNSVKPASTAVQILVSAKSTGQNTGNGSNTSGGGSSGIPNVPIIIDNPSNFEGNNQANSSYTDSSGVKHEVNTVTYTDKSKTLTDTSTDKNGTKTVVVTEKDSSGATTTVATRVTTKDGTDTYTVIEYVDSNTTKTTTNKSDTKGNTYARVYTAKKDGSYNENITSVVSDVKTTDKYSLSSSGTISQTYKTSRVLDGEIVNITIKGTGTQASPKYTETYTIPVDSLDKCVVTVKRSNSSAKASASVVRTNEAGNKVTVTSDIIDSIDTVASWNDASSEISTVSTVHDFSSKRKSTNGTDVTYKVLNDSGDKRYTLMFNTNDIVPGNKIRSFRYTGGKYVMLGTNYKTVSDNGNLSISPAKSYTYLLAGPSTYKAVNKEIIDSAKFKSSKAANVSKSKSTTFSLSSKFSSANIKSISYKSKNRLVASVNNSGKVTGKRKGKTTITATIKFINGGSKTISRVINVK